MSTDNEIRYVLTLTTAQGRLLELMCLEVAEQLMDLYVSRCKGKAMVDKPAEIRRCSSDLNLQSVLIDCLAMGIIEAEAADKDSFVVYLSKTLYDFVGSVIVYKDFALPDAPVIKRAFSYIPADYGNMLAAIKAVHAGATTENSLG